MGVAGEWVSTAELVKALKELRDAVDMGMYSWRPGSRGFTEAHRAKQQADDVLARLRKPMPSRGKIGEP